MKTKKVTIEEEIKQEENLELSDIEKKKVLKTSELKQTEDSANLDDAFADFEKRNAEFTPEQEGEEIPIEEIKEGSEPKRDTFNENDKMKVRMLLGFALFFIAGMNVFILNKIRGAKVPVDRLDLTDKEKEDLIIYLEDPKIIEWLEKINGLWFGLIQLEYTMIRKYNAAMPEFKILKEDETDKKEKH